MAVIKLIVVVADAPVASGLLAGLLPGRHDLYFDESKFSYFKNGVIGGTVLSADSETHITAGYTSTDGVTYRSISLANDKPTTYEEIPFTRIQTLTSPGGAVANYTFGYSFAHTADMLVVGQIYVNPSSTGRALYYNKVDNLWVYGGELLAANNGIQGSFGANIQISPNGQYLGVTDIGPNATQEGGINIYKRNGANWDFQTRIAGSDLYEGFGLTISFSYDASYLVACSLALSFEFGTLPGKLKVYHRTGEVWGMTQTLSPTSLEAFNTLFGLIHALRGEYLLSYETGFNQISRLFKYIDGNFVEQQRLSLPIEGSESFGGYSVALSAKHAVIYVDNGPSTAAFYIYKRKMDGTLQESSLNIIALGAVSADNLLVFLEEDVISLGFPSTVSGFAGAGERHIYRCDADNNWREVERIISPNPQVNGDFGVSTFISKLPETNRPKTLILVESLSNESGLIHCYEA